MRPLCRDCADGDGFCDNDPEHRNCGFLEGHPLHRVEKFRPRAETPRIREEDA
jgi:hypothetical protein